VAESATTEELHSLCPSINIIKLVAMGDHVTCLVTVNISLGLISKHHAMKTYEGAEV
jgi:hypothetical protein